TAGLELQISRSHSTRSYSLLLAFRFVDFFETCPHLQQMALHSAILIWILRSFLKCSKVDWIGSPAKMRKEKVTRNKTSR
ncbi:hypothetical protein ANCCAN_07794, partial [Ancylostoma caninum]